jgi:predicted extracellular nuclease
VLQALAGQPEIEATYEIIVEDGPDVRGIDVALMYQADRATLLEQHIRQGCTDLVDGLGPDGNLDMQAPENLPTCDLNGDGLLDGNRLFSRPPLVVQFEICPTGCAIEINNLNDRINLWVVVNHMKSKMQDTLYNQYTLPRRILQAEFVTDIAQTLHDSDPNSNVILIGDLNDFPDSQPLLTLANAGLLDLTTQIDKPERYSFIHHGVSQVLDYILYFPTSAYGPTAVGSVHINADFPAVFADVPDTYYRSSDHDPVISSFTIYNHNIYFPLSPAN